jgi:hypothetical protein
MQWEYKTITLKTGGFMGGDFETGDLDRMLNKLGRDGWELTSAFDTSQGAGKSRDIVVLLKRPAGS